MGTPGGAGGQRQGRVGHIYEEGPVLGQGRECGVFYRWITRIQARLLDVWRKVASPLLFDQAQNLRLLENSSGLCFTDYLLYLDVIKFCILI